MIIFCCCSEKFLTGVTHLIVSSTALGIRSGLFLSFENSSGFSIKARILPAVDDDVVHDLQCNNYIIRYH